MQQWGKTLQGIIEHHGYDPLPDEAQCKTCGFFDIENEEVKAIISVRDPKKPGFVTLKGAACKCTQPETKEDRMLADAARFRESNIPKREGGPREFNNFQSRLGTSAMLEAAQLFAQGLGPRFLTFWGEPGNGKSHLLEAVGRKMLKGGATVRYEYVPQFLERLRHSYRDDSGGDLHELHQQYTHYQVLLLDDVGAEHGTPWAQSELGTIIENRLQTGGRTIVATNQTKEQMQARLGPRLADRLHATNLEMGDVVLIVNEATSFREGK